MDLYLGVGGGRGRGGLFSGFYGVFLGFHTLMDLKKISKPFQFS